jgi:hypothetical protein
VSLRFYVYAYLRSKDSSTAKAGTPYYIGKGSKNRAWDKHRKGLKVPTDKSCIVILEKNLSELGALAIERRMIRWYGRKDLGSGILHNMQDGGEGSVGILVKESTRLKMSLARKGKISHRKGKVGTFSTGARTEEQKQYQIDRSPSRIEILIDGILYKSIEQAAKELNLLPKTVGCRSKNPNFPNYIRIEKCHA